MKKLVAVLLMLVSTVCSAEILAVWEESPNGLVQVDKDGNPTKPAQLQQVQQSQRDEVIYVPGRVYPDYIYRPMYKMVNVFVPECNCNRTIKVRIN